MIHEPKASNALCICLLTASPPNRAQKHRCESLRRAAIPLAATNFDRIDHQQLMLLTAADMRELLASDQLSSTEVFYGQGSTLEATIWLVQALWICSQCILSFSWLGTRYSKAFPAISILKTCSLYAFIMYGKYQCQMGGRLPAADAK